MKRRGQSSWAGAIGLSFLGVYGPFLAVAVYTWIYVACDHCKTTWLKYVGLFPGSMVYELAAGYISVLPRHVGNSIASPLGVGLSLAFVGGFAVLMRPAGWKRWAVFFGVLAVFTPMALVAYSLVRA